MGRHSKWVEDDHPRAFDGTFSRSEGDGAARNTSTSRGMPDTITGADIPIRDGREIALDAHPDGSVTISTGKTMARLSDHAASDLMYDLDHIAHEGAVVGEEAWVSSVEYDSHGRPGGPKHVALIRKEGDDSYSLRFPPSDNPSTSEMRNAPDVRLNRKDIDTLRNAHLRSNASSRVETGNGEVDIYLTDDSKFAMRHVGDDGRPVEMKLNPTSYAKIKGAIDVVIDGWDEEDDTLADDEVVTKRTVATNAGRITVQLIGTHRGTSPDDRLRITADDDSWGIVVDGPRQDAFLGALSKVEDVGEDLEIYEPRMKWRM